MALDLAHRVRDQYDAVAWVDLAPLTDPKLIAQQMLTQEPHTLEFASARQ